MNRIFVIVNDFVRDGWKAEHGLSLAVEFGGTRFLFDTGAGNALVPNLVRFGIEPGTFEFLVLSHGHNDHTGGIPVLVGILPKPIPVWFLPGLTKERYSLSPPVSPEALTGGKIGAGPEKGAPRKISMPPESVRVLENLPMEYRNEVHGWTKVRDGIFLTGSIPRRSGERAGGAFYFDSEGNVPDTIPDEEAVVLFDGVKGTLVHGCCHSGLINTLDYCAEQMPEIPIKTVIGGLHLVRAGEERLKETIARLNASEVERLIVFHCTGERAEGYLRRHFSGTVESARGGDRVEF